MDELPQEENSSENDSNEESDLENELKDEVPENEEENSKNEDKGKKRKKKKSNQRKKIRKLLTQDKLAPETLSALQEEENRQKRLELLKQQNAGNQIKTSEDSDFDFLTSNDFDDIADEIIGKHGGFEQTAKPEDIVALAVQTDSQNTQEIAPAVRISSTAPLQTSDDVICISSDDEDKDIVIVNNSVTEDSDDDVICTGDNLNAIADNGGIHVDDEQNVQDENGCVLINVNRPPTEEPIYLSSKLTPFVKPHQIGGIRFMFDNIIETIETFSASNGLGCILAHAMGLGKTLQCVSFIDIFLKHTTAKTVLCIVPVNTLLNWINEFKHWLDVGCSNSESQEEGPFKLYMLGDGQKTIASRAEIVAKWSQSGGVMLMGYEMYRQLASKKIGRRKHKNNGFDEQFNKLNDLLNNTYSSIVNPGPDLVICDEGHRIKNSHAGISKVLKLIRTQRRIVLTGYPLQNNLMEYWCMVDFVRPNFLGTKQEFSNMFERPIHNGQCLDSTQADIRLMRFRSHVLFTQLKGFVQRRSHEVLKQNLPLKEEHVLLVRLSSWQKKLYNFFIRDQLQTSPAWYNLNPIKAFSICCKIWNHPDIIYFTAQEKTETNKTDTSLLGDIFAADVDLDIPDNILRGQRPKAMLEKENGLSYDWIVPLLEGYKPNVLELSGKLVLFVKILSETVAMGEKLLLFSQSLNTLNLIEKFLSNIKIPAQEGAEATGKCWVKNESYFRLDGNTNSAERERLIKLFNAHTNTNVHLFLLSTRAGCLGINLTGANRVVVFDASWNPCHDAQAVCRVYRYGQQKKCHIYRLVTDNTMEKKIYDRQISKQGMSDRVVDKLNPIQSITRADVSKLLFYSEEDPAPIDLSKIEEDYSDSVLKTVLKSCSGWLTKKPFLHESLFIDNKGQRLTTAEINAAQREYNIEKRSSTTFNNSRSNYSDFYSANGNGLTRSKSMVQFNTKQSIPSLQTPNPMNPAYIKQAGSGLQRNDNIFDSRSLYELAKAGISVNKMRAGSDVPMPGVTGTGQPFNVPQKVLVRAGETMYIIKGQKGVYMGTPSGQIFARKSQKFQPNPEQYHYEYNQESRLVHAIFNRVAKKRLLSAVNQFNAPSMQPSMSYPTFSNISNGAKTVQQAPMLNQLLSTMPGDSNQRMPSASSTTSMPINLLDDANSMDANSMDSNGSNSFQNSLFSNNGDSQSSLFANNADSQTSQSSLFGNNSDSQNSQSINFNGVVPLSSTSRTNQDNSFAKDIPAIPSVEALTSSVQNSLPDPSNPAISQSNNFLNGQTQNLYFNYFQQNLAPFSSASPNFSDLIPTAPLHNSISSTAPLSGTATQPQMSGGTVTPPPLSYENFQPASLGTSTL